MGERPGAGGGRQEKAHGTFPIGDHTEGASAASQSACDPKNGQKEAGGGRGVMVTQGRGHSRQEKAGWVSLAYSLGELLVCESSVPKTQRDRC